MNVGKRTVLITFEGNEFVAYEGSEVVARASKLWGLEYAVWALGAEEVSQDGKALLQDDGTSNLTRTKK